MSGRKSGQVLVRTQKANTPARRGWNADRAQPFLVIATRDASSISDDRQKKRTGFGPNPESEHPGQTRLECRSRTAISCDSRERREQHFRRPAEKADRFWSAPNQRTRRPEAAGMPAGHNHCCYKHRDAGAAFQTGGRKSGKAWIRIERSKDRPVGGGSG